LTGTPDDRPGREPDPRFTFANERTFLAWARTGLALVGGGLLAAEVLRSTPVAALVVAIPTIAFGGLLAVLSYIRWEANERALRLGAPLDRSSLVRRLAVGTGVIAAVCVVAVVVAALTR
jgi:putative membrane protein